MKIGDLVKWSEVESTYQRFAAYPNQDITAVISRRQCGIVVDSNPYVFFVHWLSGEYLAQKPDTIEVISESR
tara:strand:- start:635 stop:850 length:216 start_codon:yes stop_codon:yes gene_type:complete